MLKFTALLLVYYAYFAAGFSVIALFFLWKSCDFSCNVLSARTLSGVPDLFFFALGNPVLLALFAASEAIFRGNRRD